MAVQRRTVAELAWRLPVDVFVRFGIHLYAAGITRRPLNKRFGENFLATNCLPRDQPEVGARFRLVLLSYDLFIWYTDSPGEDRI